MMAKLCIVPSCPSTSTKTNKIFWSVPNNVERRKAWFAAVGKTNVPKGHKYYCCEDHFDLPNDSSNWIRFKFMEGRTLRLKKEAVPHRNLSKPFFVRVKDELETTTFSSTKKRRTIDEVAIKIELTSIEEDLSASSIDTKFSTELTSLDKDIDGENYKTLLKEEKDTSIELLESRSRFYIGLPKDSFMVVHITPNENGVCSLQDPLST